MEDKPDVTYDDVGGAKDALEKLREVVELPLLHPEKFINLGIDPPKGVLLYGPPGTGKTLSARAVANRTDACFIRVIGSELVQKYVGEGGRLVRELFTMARSKKACIVFFDEVDAIGGARSSTVRIVCYLLHYRTVLHSTIYRMMEGLIMKCNEPCFKLSQNWMDLILVETSKCSWQPIDRILWIQH